MFVYPINVAQLLCVFLQPVSIKGNKRRQEPWPKNKPNKTKLYGSESFQVQKTAVIYRNQNQSENGLVYIRVAIKIV